MLSLCPIQLKKVKLNHNLTVMLNKILANFDNIWIYDDENKIGFVAEMNQNETHDMIQFDSGTEHQNKPQL